MTHHLKDKHCKAKLTKTGSESQPEHSGMWQNMPKELTKKQDGVRGKSKAYSPPAPSPSYTSLAG